MDYLRPDERANKAKTDRSDAIKDTVKTVALGAGAATLSTALSSKLMPFLNQYIPSDLAVKGISKVSPKVGEFLKKGQSMGLDVKDGLDFIKKKMQPKEDKNNKQKNIIEEHSPELHEMIVERIGQGLKPRQVAEQLAKEGKFNKQIADLQAKTKTGIGQLISAVYGVEDDQQPQQKPKGPQEYTMAQLQAEQQAQQGQQQAPQQGNNYEKQLLDRIDKLLNG